VDVIQFFLFKCRIVLATPQLKRVSVSVEFYDNVLTDLVSGVFCIGVLLQTETASYCGEDGNSSY